MVKQVLEGNAWHADHIIPVYAGGGMCQLDNLRTLCVPCHQVSFLRPRLLLGMAINRKSTSGKGKNGYHSFRKILDRFFGC